MKTPFGFILMAFLFGSCGKNKSALVFNDTGSSNFPQGQEVTFSDIKSQITSPHCVKCHTNTSTESGLKQWINPGHPETSKFFLRVEDGSMPPEGALPTSDLEMIRNYIEQMVTTPAPNPAPAPNPSPIPAPIPSPSDVTYSQIKSQVLVPYRCLNCHSVGTESSIRKWINTTTPSRSLLYTRVHDGSMPRGGPVVSSSKQALLLQYVTDFAATH